MLQVLPQCNTDTYGIELQVLPLCIILILLVLCCRFSYRLLFLFIIAGSASFLIMMLSVESRQTVRKVNDDVVPMRHVASVANVDNVAVNDAVVDQGEANATKVIDPELREAMDRLGMPFKPPKFPKTSSNLHVSIRHV